MMCCRRSFRISAFWRFLGIVVAGLLACGVSSAETQHKPVRAWDLHSFGYSDTSADYSLAGFISEDLLLVAINQAPIDYPHPLLRESPDTTLILFSVSSGKTLGTVRTPMSKANGSMAPALDGHFLVLTQSQIMLCSTDLRCEKSLPTKGPLGVSSDRTTAIVGGNFGTPRVALDSRTLAPIEDAGRNSSEISAESRTVYCPDGSFAESIVSVDGQRQMTVEVKQTRWNKFMNPLSGLGDRPYNSRRITVFDKPTGKEVFTLKWDPRRIGGGVTTMPSLSPTGHKIAVVRRGVAEVFDVP